MTAHELLSQLRAKGVELQSSGGDRLVIDAPKGTVTEELRAALSANKAELLQILNAEAAEAAAPRAVEPPPVVETAPSMQEAPVAQPAVAVPSPLSDIAEQVAHSIGSTVSQAEISSTSPVDSTPIDPEAAGAADEISRLQDELMHLRREEESRRAAVEAARIAADNEMQAEQERLRQQEENLARQRAEHERQRIEAEARERAEEEHRRQLADEEIARVANHLAQIREDEDLRRKQIEERSRAAILAHESELAALRQAEEQQAQQRAEQERKHIEAEARRRTQEEELRRQAESRLRMIEEEVERVQAREAARIKAAEEARRLAEEAERHRIEEETRRKAEEIARRRAAEEAKLRAEIEAQLRAEAEERRRAEEEIRRQAEEEARRRAEEEAQVLAAERARRLAEEEAQRRAEEQARLQAEEAARARAEEEARREAEEQARLRVQQEERNRVDAETRERAELEARLRAEIEGKIRAEESERRETEERSRAEAEARWHAEHERIVAEEAARNAAHTQQYPFELERSEVEEPVLADAVPPKVNEIQEWFETDLQNRKEIAPVTAEDYFHPRNEAEASEFRPVSIPEENFGPSGQLPAVVSEQLISPSAAQRITAVSNLPHIGGEEAFRHITAAFDDPTVEVRSAAARALFDLQEDRAAAFTRALREATPDRRRKIGAAIASSGLANEAIRNLTGESRDKTYDAFSLLFLMSKAGEVQSLMRAIEEHPNIEVRLAVVKLLALSGQPDILPSFRRMAVRGSLPPEVRSAVMEAIYQITSQSPAEAQSTM